jgi:ABC-type transport system involved in cytochrome c biogenesis permease subunit
MRVLDNGADYFLWVSWATALVFFFFRRKLEYPIVGAFVVPVIVAFMGSSSYLLHAGAESLVARQEGRVSVVLSLVHAVPALVSVVSLAMALIVSAVFLVVERRLKRRPAVALLSSGPDLQLLDRLNRQLVQIGFVAISLVVVSGGLWAVSQQKPIFTFDTSVISGIAVWLLLACILHARLVLGWSPKRVSRFTILVTASFFASVFVVMAMAGRITHASLWS